jgi:hypothetical protein
MDGNMETNTEMSRQRPPLAHRVARLGAAWIAGVVASMATILGVESVGRVLYPPPAGLDPSRVADAVAIAVAMPPAAFGVVVIGWVLGAFIGSLLAVRLARGAGLLMAAGIAALVLSGIYSVLTTLPHPAWCGWVAVPGTLLAALLAARLGRRWEWGRG